MRFYSFIILSFFFQSAFSQIDTTQIIIEAIEIEGNKRTKDAVIIRELSFQKGDKISLTDLEAILKTSQQNIQNTGLFVKTEITNKVSKWNDQSIEAVTVKIEVRESWYIYPYVIFELADRNFNVWWNEMNRSLKRVNFGVSLNHLNLTGRRDKLKLTIQDGYTKKYELDYNLPGINKAQTIGAFANIFYSRRKEIAYITDFNKLLFFQEGDVFQLQRFRIGGGITYRPGIFQYHTFKVLYSDNSIGDRIADELNTDYFFNNSNRQRHLTLQYDYTIDKRDIKPYPLNGYLGTFLIQKDGAGITPDVNSLSLSAKWVQYYSFTKKLSVELFAKGKVELIRKKQPYTHVSYFGYDENYLRGFELYVVDGMDMAMLKSAVRYELINREFDFGPYMPIRQFKLMPFKLYFSVHNDIGYVNAPFYDSYGTLNNKLLWGGGIGLDFMLYFDKVIQIQYSFNNLSENGLFLHFKLSF